MDLFSIKEKLSMNTMQTIQGGIIIGAAKGTVIPAGRQMNGNCFAGWCCLFGGMMSSEFGVGCFAIAAGAATIGANC